MQAEQKQRSIPEKICFYLRQDIRGTQIILYGVAGIGLMVALRRIKPFARYTRPSDIPDRYFKSKVHINANVIRIEPGGAAGPLLMVETIPLLPLLRFGRRKQLPIKIANIDVTSNGISWLQSVVCSKEIIFEPLMKNKDSVDSKILLVQPNKNNIEVGKELVRLGFGIVQKQDKIIGPKSKENTAYRASLLAAQKWAERQRNGHWHYTISPTILWKLKTTIFATAKSVLPGFFTRQLNI